MSNWSPVPIPGWKPGMHRLFRNTSKAVDTLHRTLTLYLCDTSGDYPDDCDDGPLRVSEITEFDQQYSGRQVVVAIDVCCESDPEAPDPELFGNPDGVALVSVVVAEAIAAYFGRPFPPKMKQ